MGALRAPIAGERGAEKVVPPRLEEFGAAGTRILAGQEYNTSAWQPNTMGPTYYQTAGTTGTNTTYSAMTTLGDADKMVLR